jgi:hypothetical protein
MVEQLGVALGAWMDGWMADYLLLVLLKMIL